MIINDIVPFIVYNIYIYLIIDKYTLFASCQFPNLMHNFKSIACECERYMLTASDRFWLLNRNLTASQWRSQEVPFTFWICAAHSMVPGDALNPTTRGRVMKWSFMVTKEEIKDAQGMAVLASSPEDCGFPCGFPWVCNETVNPSGGHYNPYPSCAVPLFSSVFSIFQCTFDSDHKWCTSS